MLSPSTEARENALDLFADTLTSTVEVYRVNVAGALHPVGDSNADFHGIAYAAVEQRMPLMAKTDELRADVAAAIAIPIFRGATCTSVVILAMKSSAAAGVLEIWKPASRYAELRWADGYYGSLERFQNVSSFVRFERGMGLPGQVWDLNHSVIHDDLANHPGFLRAAGASADALSSAVGIPVSSEQFIATVVLINSRELPIVRGMQAWIVNGGSFELPSSSSLGLSSIDKVDVRCRASMDVGWLRQSIESGEALWRVDDASHVCVAIPSFRRSEPRGVLALCF